VINFFHVALRVNSTMRQPGKALQEINAVRQSAAGNQCNLAKRCRRSMQPGKALQQIKNNQENKHEI